MEFPRESPERSDGVAVRGELGGVAHQVRQRDRVHDLSDGIPNLHPYRLEVALCLADTPIAGAVLADAGARGRGKRPIDEAADLADKDVFRVAGEPVTAEPAAGADDVAAGAELGETCSRNLREARQRLAISAAERPGSAPRSAFASSIIALRASSPRLVSFMLRLS